ncbi:hypothetical protein ES703_39701 [subsurface metagenome]
MTHVLSSRGRSSSELCIGQQAISGANGPEPAYRPYRRCYRCAVPVEFVVSKQLRSALADLDGAGARSQFGDRLGGAAASGIRCDDGGGRLCGRPRSQVRHTLGICSSDRRPRRIPDRKPVCVRGPAGERALSRDRDTCDAVRHGLGTESLTSDIWRLTCLASIPSFCASWAGNRFRQRVILRGAGMVRVGDRFHDEPAANRLGTCPGCRAREGLCGCNSRREQLLLQANRVFDVLVHRWDWWRPACCYVLFPCCARAILGQCFNSGACHDHRRRARQHHRYVFWSGIDPPHAGNRQ